jgi:hypothetical protein
LGACIIGRIEAGDAASFWKRILAAIAFWMH